MPRRKWATTAGGPVTTVGVAAQLKSKCFLISWTGSTAHVNRGYSEQNGYYGSRPGQSRPDSIIDTYQGQGQVPESSQYPYNQNGQRRPRHYPRMSTDQSGYSNGNGSTAQHAYPQPGYQRSYDNVTAPSGLGSGYTDPYGQSTDSSPLNSSMELQQQALQQQRMDERAQAEYGFQGYGAGSSYNGKVLPSTPAPVADAGWGGPVGGIPSAAPAGNTLRKNPNLANAGEKRKSWFKRRFSKD